MKKKGTKLLLLISVLVVAVFVSVFAITASADDTVNYYRYSYDGTTWTTVNSTMTSDPGNLLVSTANTHLKAADGNKIYIQLLSNIVSSADQSGGTAGNAIILETNANQLYFDLNGYEYHCIGTSNKDYSWPYKAARDSAFLMKQWNQKLYIYSSRPGGKIFVNRTDSSGKIISGTLVGTDNGPFAVSTINIGAYGGYSGDNLTVYASKVAFMFSSNSRAGMLTIDGGTYYQNTSSAIDDFGYISIGNSKGDYQVSGGTHIVKNATFILNDANFLSTSYDYIPGTAYSEGGYTYAPAYLGKDKGGQAISISNCTIQTTGNFIGHYWSECASAEVTNSNILCTVDNSKTGSITFGSGTCITDENPTNVNIADGYITAVSNQTVNINKVVADVSYSGNSATISERTEPLNYSISRMYTLLSNVQTVNWKLGEDTISEYYCDGVTPSCPLNIPLNGKYYQFVCSEDITPAVKGTSVSYEFSQKSTVKILTNISLYRDFVYNIYIPTDAVDDGGIKSVTIEGRAVDFSTLDKKVVSKRNCYVATVKIPAANGNTGYPVVIETNGYNGNVITDNYTVSIPKYANAVLNGDFRDEAKELVKSTLAYIIAAYNYARDDENHGIVLPDGYTTPVFNGSQMTGLSGDAFLGAQLEITSKLIFRFFTKSVDVSNTPIKLTYYVDGVLTEKTLTPEEVKVLGKDQYFDLEVNIFDLRYNITAECSDGSRLDYRLSNYIYAMKHPNDPIANQEEMDALMNTLYEYATRANLYGQTEPETPIADVIKVNGNTVTPNSYEILLSADNDEQRAAAAVLQNQIREKTGYTLKIVTQSTTGKNAIKILVSTVYSNDFEVSVSGNDLLVKCAFNSFVSTGATSFALNYIANVIEEYNFTSFFKTTEYKAEFVTYKDYGAKGDGVTDDYSAMSAAHDRANSSGYLTVKVNDGSYNVGKHTPIFIKTSVDFTGATIIIDDKDFTVSQANIFQNSVFKVVSDYRAYVHQSDALVSSVNTALLNPDSYNSSTTTSATQIFGKNYLDNLHYSGSKVMLVIEDTNAAQKVFIRFPANASDGVDPKELIIVNADGTLDKSAGLVLTYAEVDKVTEYRIDDAQITITGGKFITRANNFTDTTGGNAYYFGRGIDIYRSNTVIDGIDHLIVDEVDSSDYRGSSPYGGFITTNNCSDVTIKKSTLQAHRQYKHPTNGTWAGTYDIGASLANNITYQKVKQRGFDPNNVWNVYNEDGTLKTAGRVDDNIKTWGIMGTNYCKNFTWDTCTLSRFDAHAGVYNATIKDSKVNEIALIGGGTANIINTHVYSRQNNILQLRGDYGSTWNGDLNITDVTFHNCKPAPAPWMAIIQIHYYNHDFGYQTYLPRNINITNFNVCQGTGCEHSGHQTTSTTTSGGGGLYIFEAYNYLYGKGSGNTSYFDFNADNVPVNSAPSAGDNYDSSKTYENINKFILPETVSITTNKATDYITFYGIKFGTVGGFTNSTAFEKTWKDGLKTTVTYKTSDGGKTYKK